MSPQSHTVCCVSKRFLHQMRSLVSADVKFDGDRFWRPSHGSGFTAFSQCRLTDSMSGAFVDRPCSTSASLLASALLSLFFFSFSCYSSFSSSFDDIGDVRGSVEPLSYFMRRGRIIRLVNRFAHQGRKEPLNWASPICRRPFPRRLNCVADRAHHSQSGCDARSWPRGTFQNEVLD